MMCWESFRCAKIINSSAGVMNLVQISRSERDFLFMLVVGDDRIQGIAFPEWARLFHSHPAPVDEVCGGALDQSCLK